MYRITHMPLQQSKKVVLYNEKCTMIIINHTKSQNVHYFYKKRTSLTGQQTQYGKFGNLKAAIRNTNQIIIHVSLTKYINNFIFQTMLNLLYN